MRHICVLGLGFVGAEVARLGAEREFQVSAVDVDPDVVDTVNTGEMFPDQLNEQISATTDAKGTVASADSIVIAVPTPLDSGRSLNLSILSEAVLTTAEGIAGSSSDTPPLVVIESTIPPGTVRGVAMGIFEDQGLTVGEDVYLAHAPERIDPGSDGWPLERIPRVVGAVTDDGLNEVVRLYDELLEADVHPVPTPEVAECAKIIENAFRDVNIAFVNELALSLDRLQIDVSAVLDAAATKPFGFMRFSPGAGVGGHCIPVDPYMLIEEAAKSDFDHQFLKLARDINDRMPRYVAEKTVKALIKEGILPQDSRVLLLGKAFKPDVPDTRNTPHDQLAKWLCEEYGVTVESYDPVLSENSSVDSPYASVDAVVLVTAHEAFDDLDFRCLASEGVRLFVDGRNAFDSDEVKDSGLRYVGVGR